MYPLTPITLSFSLSLHLHRYLLGDFSLLQWTRPHVCLPFHLPLSRATLQDMLSGHKKLNVFLYVHLTFYFSSVPKEMQKGAYVHSHLFSFLRKRCHRLGKSKYPEAFQCSCMTHHAATTTIYVWGLITFVLTAWRYKT